VEQPCTDNKLRSKFIQTVSITVPPIKNQNPRYYILPPPQPSM